MGQKQYEVSPWFGVLAPGAPPEVQAKIAKSAAEVKFATVQPD